MLRAMAAGFTCFALCAIGGQATAAATPNVLAMPGFVQAKLTEFSACAQRQKIRDIPAIPDARMELCGANFMWPREYLATVRKCLTRGKIFSVEKLPSYKTPSGTAFSISYDCAIPHAWLSIDVETREDSARVTDIFETME